MQNVQKLILIRILYWTVLECETQKSVLWLIRCQTLIKPSSVNQFIILANGGGDRHEVAGNTQHWYEVMCIISWNKWEVQWLRLAFSNGPNRIGCLHPLIWGRKQIQFPKLYSLVFRTVNNVQKDPAIQSVRILYCFYMSPCKLG
jgi:hypothetical protein